MPVKIKGVYEDSIAEEACLQSGDVLVSINDIQINDVLDYKYAIANEECDLEIHKANGETEIIEVYNGDFEDLGIIFDSSLMDKPRNCRNKCIFCFIDQLPSNMRETLYFKDDDYRLSVLQGNYVTLTNCSEADIERIIKYRLPRINISVHASDLEVRRRMLSNPKAQDIVEIMRKFAEVNIKMNAQIVLCPNVNDGAVLDKTIADLGELAPDLESVSVVPVGLSKFREGLHDLQGYNKQTANEVIGQIEKKQGEFLRKHGTRLVYLSDEFYLLSGREIPTFEEYEEFYQLENGVGMIADFIYGFNMAKREIAHKITSKTIATGKLFKPVLENLIKTIPNNNAKIIDIENKFFGEQITVAGLVTGGDIIEQLKGIELGEMLLIPRTMLRAGEDVFLDDVRICDVENALGVKVEACENDGADFYDMITR